MRRRGHHRSFEDAAQAIDSIGLAIGVFILFGGPPRAIRHSFEDAVQPIDSIESAIGVFIVFGGPPRPIRHSPGDAVQVTDSARAPGCVFKHFGGPQAHRHSPEDAVQVIDSATAPCRVFRCFGGPQAHGHSPEDPFTAVGRTPWSAAGLRPKAIWAVGAPVRPGPGWLPHTLVRGFINFGGPQAHGHSLRSCERVGRPASLTDASVCPTLPPNDLPGRWGRRFCPPTDFSQPLMVAARKAHPRQGQRAPRQGAMPALPL